MSKEISTFLSKKPLKMAASTIYSIQKLDERGLAGNIILDYDNVRELIGMDVSFLEGYYPPATELIPEKYKQITENLLFQCAKEMQNVELFEKFEVYNSISDNK